MPDWAALNALVGKLSAAVVPVLGLPVTADLEVPLALVVMPVLAVAPDIAVVVEGWTVVPDLAVTPVCAAVGEVFFVVEGWTVMPDLAVTMVCAADGEVFFVPGLCVAKRYKEI